MHFMLQVLPQVHYRFYHSFSPAQMRSMTGSAVIHLERPSFLALRSHYIFLINLWKNVIMLEDEVCAGQSRTSVIRKCRCHKGCGNELGHPLRCFRCVDIMEKKFLWVFERRKSVKLYPISCQQYPGFLLVRLT
jgi:hypothetical protein